MFAISHSPTAQIRVISAMTLMAVVVLAAWQPGIPVALAAAVSVLATVETDPVPSSGDAADDPAIWIHPTDPSRSVIIGTDKTATGGLGVYDLSGHQIAFYADGRYNNVDVRYGFRLGSSTVDIVGVTNRVDKRMDFYKIDPSTRALARIGSVPTTSAIVTPRGFAFYKSPTSGKFYAFVSDSGKTDQYELSGTSGSVTGTVVRQWTLPNPTEGLVADDELQRVYLAEENIGGIWRYGAEPTASTVGTKIASTTETGGTIVQDVKGLAMYVATGGAGYLLAISQGGNSFHVFDRQTNAELGEFKIVAGNGIDAVTGMDGIDATSVALSSAFPSGLFVSQDTANDTGNQNFKVVPWQSIANAFSPRLLIDTGWDPRGGGGQPGPTPTPSSSPTPTAVPTPTTAPTPTVGPTPTTAPTPTVGPNPTPVAGGTIVREGVATVVNTTATNQVTLPTPAGTRSGDVLVACLALNGGLVAVGGVPSGWSPIAAVTTITNPRVYGYVHVVGSTEPSARTWTLSSAVANGAGMARYSGVDPTSPIDGIASSATGAAALTATIPGVSASSTSAMLAGCVGINSASTSVVVTSPAGMSEAWDVGGKRHDFADQRLATAGGTGARTWTLSSAREWAGWLAALRPAAGGAGPTPSPSPTSSPSPSPSPTSSPSSSPSPTSSPSPSPSPTATEPANAIRRAAISTVVNGTATSTIVVAKPAGTTAGDVLVACLALNGGNVAANGAPAGWSTIATVTSVANPRVMGYYRVVGSTEPTTYTWVLTSSVANGAGIARYVGADPSQPMDGAPSMASAASGTAATLPSVSTTTPSSMLVGCLGINSGATSVTIASPSGMTQAWDIAGKRQELADQLLPSAGSTGTRTWTLSASRAWAGLLVALRD